MVGGEEALSEVWELESGEVFGHGEGGFGLRGRVVEAPFEG